MCARENVHLVGIGISEPFHERAPVDATGAYQLDIRKSPVAGNARVSIESACGGVLLSEAVRHDTARRWITRDGFRRGAQRPSVTCPVPAGVAALDEGARGGGGPGRAGGRAGRTRIPELVTAATPDGARAVRPRRASARARADCRAHSSPDTRPAPQSIPCAVSAGCLVALVAPSAYYTLRPGCWAAGPASNLTLLLARIGASDFRLPDPSNAQATPRTATPEAECRRSASFATDSCRAPVRCRPWCRESIPAPTSTSGSSSVMLVGGVLSAGISVSRHLRGVRSALSDRVRAHGLHRAAVIAAPSSALGGAERLRGG